MNDVTKEAQIIADYEKICTSILEDDAPRYTILGQASHAQLVDFICSSLKIESFDVLGEPDWLFAYNNDDVVIVTAYLFRAYFLRMVMNTAIDSGKGDPQVNKLFQALGEYWQKKLADKRVSLNNGGPVSHNWLH